jgi:hypothetical protein
VRKFAASREECSRLQNEVTELQAKIGRATSYYTNLRNQEHDSTATQIAALKANFEAMASENEFSERQLSDHILQLERQNNQLLVEKESLV